jgi:hypothetical protein
MDDLSSELLPPRVDPAELYSVIFHFFGSCEQHENDDQVLVFRERATPHRIPPPTEPSLFVEYRGKAISRITRGPGLSDARLAELREKVQGDLCGPASTRVGVAILMGTYDVRDALRVGDTLQMLPVPPESPRPPYVVAPHPFVLEFTYLRSRDPMVDIARQRRRAQDLGLLLNVLLEGVTDPPPRFGRQEWVMEIEPGAPEPMRCSLRQVGYIPKGMPPHSGAFTPIDGYSAMSVVENLDWIEAMRAGTEALRVQGFVAPLILSYETLDPTSRRQFLRSAYWFHHAHVTHAHSASAVLLALVSALDTLLPPAPSSERCPTCGLSVGTSRTKQFADYIEQLIPSVPHLRSAARDLFKLRSDLTHGWHLLDHDESAEITIAPFAANEDRHIQDARMLIKYALRRWLDDARKRHVSTQ